jgi:amino-acid N-acetyltransferase
MSLPATSTVVRPASAADWPAIERLLRARDLPPDGAHSHLDAFLVAEKDRVVVGCAGLERYEDAALLRSVAVAEPLAGRGVGKELVVHSIDLARRRGVRELYLLTNTAADYFPRFGFERLPREALPTALSASEELRGACPASAIAMRLVLLPS